ncbi:MAG: GNAT family N-acetyltransferase [Calditrichia bacterium]
MKNTFQIRNATQNDVPDLIRLVRDLAIYEKLEHEFVGTEEQFSKYGFGENSIYDALLAISENKAVGFALYFYKFSTFTGRPTLHLEDLFVDPAMRGNKIGVSLLAALAAIAVKKDCARMEWNVLDWNEPAINFYQALGASSLDGWETYRLDGDALQQLALSNKG